MKEGYVLATDTLWSQGFLSSSPSSSWRPLNHGFSPSRLLQRHQRYSTLQKQLMTNTTGRTGPSSGAVETLHLTGCHCGSPKNSQTLFQPLVWKTNCSRLRNRTKQLVLCRKQVASLKIPTCVLPMPKYNNYAKRYLPSPAISIENVLKNTLRKTTESKQFFSSSYYWLIVLSVRFLLPMWSKST